MAQNSLNNNALQAFQVPKTVYNAIKNAASRTGVNFTYLMEKAAAESSFDTNAKARTSSATGLFQFIESTWMSMVKEHGDKYGLSKYTDKIDDNGRVKDSQTRREILNLRKDPEIASYMAAEFASGNFDYLKEHVGGNIGSTELYLAHFLGAGGASGFLNAMKKSPNMAAADIFPREARANRTVFYNPKTGAPKSLGEIYAHFDKKFDGAPSTPVNTSIMTANNLAPRSHQNTTHTQSYASMENPFERLSSLLMSPTSSQSLLKIAEQPSQKDFRIFPQNLYGNLSLSPAQMMLLDDFTA
jgi:Transglycosylase SLT domain